MTVAFVIAKGHFAVGEPIFLDTYLLAPFPGDPNDENYEDPIPDVPHPFIFIIGQVTAINNSNLQRPLINLMATEYIRDQFLQSVLQYVFLLSNLYLHILIH